MNLVVGLFDKRAGLGEMGIVLRRNDYMVLRVLDTDTGVIDTVCTDFAFELAGNVACNDTYIFVRSVDFTVACSALDFVYAPSVMKIYWKGYAYSALNRYFGFDIIGNKLCVLVHDGVEMFEDACHMSVGGWLVARGKMMDIHTFMRSCTL